MRLKDLLDKEPNDKDVNITMDTRTYNVIANQLQWLLFPCDPGKILYDLTEKKKEMKKMKKDGFSCVVFLTTKEIKKHEEWSHGPQRYAVNILDIAYFEAAKNLKTNRLYFNRAIVNYHFNRVDVYFSVRSDDDDQGEREERLGKINTPYYKVRIVYPDNYELYDTRFNMIGTTDSEYANEYALYDMDNFLYVIYLTQKKSGGIPYLTHPNAKHEEIPDTYDNSGEYFEEDEEIDEDEDEDEDDGDDGDDDYDN